MGKIMNYYPMVAKKMVPDFVIDSDNSNQLEYVENYFNGTINPKKGLLITGSVGTGKTTFFKIAKEYNRSRSYPYDLRICPSFDICKDFMKDGYDGYGKYVEFTISEIQRGIYNGAKEIELVIDDLGYDKPIQYFGNTVDITGELILRRYENFVRYGNRTHATSNLDVKDLKERYGIRVYDRMIEMFNIVVLTGGSRRK